MNTADSPTPPPRASAVALPALENDVWQMTYGERLALEGILGSVRPALAIEIGTAEGGSLRRIAHHSHEVHSFDLVAPELPDVLRPGITLHPGDGHELLPRELLRLADAGRNVDLVLVDGDHSAEGVRRDVEDLLRSDAIRETVIITHDTGNEVVRSGLDAVDYGAWPKVTLVDLDLVPGHMGRDSFTGELWGGLGLIVVSESRARRAGSPDPVETRHEHHGALLATARDARASSAEPGRIAALQDEVEHLRELLGALMASPSWKVTAPLRAAKRALLSRRRG